VTARRRIGILSVRTHPLLPYFLERLAAAPELEPVVILDEREFSAKDTAIFADRTAGALAARDVGPYLARVDWKTVPSHNAPECAALVRDEAIEVVINAGTPRLLGPELLAAPTRGILNVHPGILPKYRGASCCEWAIYHDDPVGVTAHFMDEDLDSGPIIFTRELAVRRGQTYSDVRVALYRLELETRVVALRHVLDAALMPRMLPRQPDLPLFKPMSNDLLAVVKTKLAAGQYRPSPAA
jgi:folate-dependent phosphoribosylglycinamide formyltransferase PurN